jgi:hypothetical protein
VVVGKDTFGGFVEMDEFTTACEELVYCVCSIGSVVEGGERGECCADVLVSLVVGGAWVPLPPPGVKSLRAGTDGNAC